MTVLLTDMFRTDRMRQLVIDGAGHDVLETLATGAAP